jgi:hypothetical protein
MNLNKYHPSGRQYTIEESRTRAMALFRQRFVVKEPRKPHNVGRNADKRGAKSKAAQSMPIIEVRQNV